MKRSLLSTAAFLTLAVAACGPAELTVNVEVELMDPETGEQITRAIEDLEVQLLPFDRDAIFDSLTQAASRPEPQFPAELIAMRDSIQVAQEEWRTAESEWLARRERLEQITREMARYNQAEPRYRELFLQFGQQESAYLAAERRKDTAFARFDALQQAAFTDLEEARVQIENWEDEAFASYGEVVAARLRASRGEILADTTDATGRADFQASPGEYWVYARYRLTSAELYWNVRVNLERGEPFELRLTPENALRREVF